MATTSTLQWIKQRDTILAPFVQACARGDLETVRTMLPQVLAKKMINGRMPKTVGSPLLVAVAEGHIGVVSLLLDQEAVDITELDDHRSDARALAMESPNALEMLSFLLDHKRFAGWSIDDAFSDLGLTLLEQACMRGSPLVLKLLLDRGADVRKQGKWMAFGRAVPRENGLHLAAHSGSMECVKMMITAGLTPDVPDDDMQTPIFKAIRGGHLHIVQYLVEVEHVDINWVDNVGSTPRDLADVSGMHQIAIYLARKGAKSKLSTMRNPRGLFARWSRLWVQGDLPPSLSQPSISRIGNTIFISGGFDEAADPFNFDPSHAFSFSLHDIQPDTLRPLQKPQERPFSLSATRIGPYLSVNDSWDKNFTFVPKPSLTPTTPSPTRFCSVTCKTPRDLSSRANCILFDKPYEPGQNQICYFEVRILKLGDAGVVSVGLVPGDFVLDNNLPGWTKQSYAYHSDDGTYFVRKGSPVPWGPPGLEGDVIGMGIDWTSERIFFTHNGTFLGFVTPPTPLKQKLFGCIGLVGTGTEAEVIFGNAPALPTDSTMDVAQTEAQKVPPASAPWQFGFEVQSVSLTRVSPTLHKPKGSFLERQVSLTFEFLRASVAYGPWLIGFDEAESFASVFDTRTNDLFQLKYTTTSPLFEAEWIGLAIVEDKVYAYEVSPPIFDASGRPGYQLSECIDSLNLHILDLPTRAWTKVQISLKHFPKRPIIDIATSTVPYADGKLWFLNSINAPFFVDLSDYTAYPLSLDKAKDALNLWQTGSAWAIIPSYNDIIRELNENDQVEAYGPGAKAGDVDMKAKNAKNEEIRAVQNASITQIAPSPEKATKTASKKNIKKRKKKNAKNVNPEDDEEDKEEGKEAAETTEFSIAVGGDTTQSSTEIGTKSDKYHLEMVKWDGISDLRKQMEELERRNAADGAGNPNRVPEFKTIRAPPPTREQMEDMLLYLSGERATEEENGAGMDVAGDSNKMDTSGSAGNIDDDRPQMIVFGGLLKDARDSRKAALLTEDAERGGGGGGAGVAQRPNQPVQQPLLDDGAGILPAGNGDRAAGEALGANEAEAGEAEDMPGAAPVAQDIPARPAARPVFPAFMQEMMNQVQFRDDDDDEEEGTAMWTSETALFAPRSRTWNLLRIQGFAPTPKGQSGLVYADQGRILNFGGNQGPTSLDELELLTLSSSFSTEQKISRYFDKPLFSDIKITVNPSPDVQSTGDSRSGCSGSILAVPRTLQLHRAILVGRSQFFRDLLLPQTAISNSSSASASRSSLETSPAPITEWEVPNSLSKHMIQILHYLYADTVSSDLLPEEFLSFLDAAEKIIPEHLPRLSEIFLLSHLTKASDSSMSQLGTLLFDPSHFTDATVIAEGTPIPCHRVILCSRSEYFNALFSNNMMIEGQMGVAEIADIPHAVCLQLIRFLYTQTIDFDALEPIVIDALIWSQTLYLHDLTRQLGDVVGASLTLENVDYLLELASTHQLSRLQAQCQRFKTSASVAPKTALKKKSTKKTAAGENGDSKWTSKKKQQKKQSDEDDDTGDDQDEEEEEEDVAPKAKRFKRNENATQIEADAFGDLSDKEEDTKGVRDAKQILRTIFGALRHDGAEGGDVELEDGDEEAILAAAVAAEAEDNANEESEDEWHENEDGGPDDYDEDEDDDLGSLTEEEIAMLRAQMPRGRRDASDQEEAGADAAVEEEEEEQKEEDVKPRKKKAKKSGKKSSK